MNDTELVEAMVKFMKQTNEMLVTLKNEVFNLKIDIEKLKKHQTRNLIITRHNITDAVGKEYNGGNGEYKSG